MEFFDFDNASEDSSTRIALPLHGAVFGVVGIDTPVDDEATVDSEGLYQSLDDAADNGKENRNRWLQTGLRSSSPCDHCRDRQLDCLIENRWELELHDRVVAFQNASEATAPDYEATDMALKRFASGGGFNDAIDTGAEPRKSSTRFSRDSLRILRRWFDGHSRHPYPTEEEKIELTSKTGLKGSQVSNWLANTRRRSKLQACCPRSPSPNSSIDVSPKSSISISHTRPLTCEDMDPMERWRNSPPENEGASVVDIVKALTQVSLPPSTKQERRAPTLNSQLNVFRATPMASFQSSGSSSHSNSSIASSAHSHRSLCTFGSHKRRRYPRRSASQSTINIQERSSNIFQCTFCTGSFKTKYDWSRHETSVHLPLESWTCSPLGGIVYPEHSPPLCSFCDALNPDTEHLEKHQYFRCLERPAEERTFFRKDHLRQHLHRIHECTFIPRMETWRFTLQNIHSRCGFCDMEFDTWSSRTNHLAAHYRCGASMNQWRGSWGLAPHVLAMVDAPVHRSVDV